MRNQAVIVRDQRGLKGVWTNGVVATNVGEFGTHPPNFYQLLRCNILPMKPPTALGFPTFIAAPWYNLKLLGCNGGQVLSIYELVIPFDWTLRLMIVASF